jgi:predicted HicB family RNase H-like nuclease
MLVEKQQFNIYLPPELINRIKHQAIDEQLSLSDLVEKIITQYLKGKKNERSK